MARFIPKEVLTEQALTNVAIENGALIMVLEDGSLRLDTKVPDPQTGEYALQRVVIGNGAEWGKILQKPFEALSADFVVIANSTTGVNELFISNNYKFNNKSTLDKFSESGGSLLFNGQPIVAGGISIKGRVDTGSLLPDEGTNQEGDIYLVGYGSDAQTPSSVYSKYIWIATDTQTPRWEPLFLTQYSWSMITDKPTINSHALEGNVTLADIGAAAVSDVTAIKAMIANSFSTESAYAIDDYVIYNNVLYKFTSAHSAGAWNSAEVTAIQVSDMIGSGGGSSYTLPAATTTTLGGIKVGEGLSIAQDGTLSVTGSSFSNASMTTLFEVQDYSSGHTTDFTLSESFQSYDALIFDMGYTESGRTCFSPSQLIDKKQLNYLLNHNSDDPAPRLTLSNDYGETWLEFVIASTTSFIEVSQKQATLLRVRGIKYSRDNYTATALASGWSNSAPYTQTIIVNGLTSSMNPIIDVVLSDTISTAINEETSWSYISKATTGTNNITLKCYENKPTVDLDFVIKT